MLAIGFGLKVVASALALAWLGWVGWHRAFSRLNVMWSIFCVGLISVIAIEIAGRAALGPVYALLAIGSCASCSFFWLTSRELFRLKPRLGKAEIALVGGIFLPTVFDQLAFTTGLGAVVGDAALSAWMTRLDGLQTLLSSAALVLVFGEGLNGWTAVSPAEKRVRYIFLGSFGAGVGACVMLFDHGRLELVSAGVTVFVQGICAVAIMVCASITVLHRHAHPLRAEARRQSSAATEAERALARQVEALVASGAYLDPELKVSTLAERLNQKDYKVTRAIVAGLGQPNFNRFINRFRIDHAKTLLADPAIARRGILNVALDSGFASLGPFNRAFKEETGITPREYRKDHECARPGAGDLRPGEALAR